MIKTFTEVFAKRCPKGKCKRAVLFLSSSANLYIIDPQGRHTGVDPATGQIVEEIPSILYYSGPGEEVEYVVIEDLEGTWNVEVIGTETGSYTLISKVVDQKDPVIDHVTKTTSPGKVDRYPITYPITPGNPIQLAEYTAYLPLVLKDYPPATMPDLVPYQDQDWQYPVVPSSVEGTHTVNTLYAGRPTYIDWGVLNRGAGDVSGNFFVDLYVDNTRLIHYPFSELSSGAWLWFEDWREVIGNPGWHTLRIVVDAEGTIAEADENNNTWQHQFYWEPPGG